MVSNFRNQRWSSHERTRGKRRRTITRSSRTVLFERLEARHLLAVDWRNPADSLDVNSDGFVAPHDALQVINDLNRNGVRELTGLAPSGAPYVDVNGDQFATAIDVLGVINALNGGIVNQRVLTEGNSLVTESTVTITLDQSAGSRTYRVKLEIEFDASDNQAREDVLNVYLERSSGETLLGGAAPGSALFSIQGEQAEFRNDQVRWDGFVLDIDLTSLTEVDTGVLTFQLINHDNDLGSRVSITPLTNIVNPNGMARAAHNPLENAAAPGPALNLSDANVNANVVTNWSHVRFDAPTGIYEIELQVENRGESVDADAAVVFSGFPSGVTLGNASGTTPGGEPYVNVSSAISGESLGKGQSSRRILVQINDPAQQRFAMNAQVVSKLLTPLTINPISEITVQPGRQVIVDLESSGGAPDLPLTYTVDLLSGSPTLPTGKIEGQGKLIFEPLLEDVGSYSFEVLATNGQETTRREVVVHVVADAETTSRLFGFVKGTEDEPLADVPVSVGNVTTTTAADGSFLLDFGTSLPNETAELLVQGSALGTNLIDFAYNLDVVLGHAMVPGERTDLSRPIYLAQIDVAHGVTIDPNLDTLVTNPSIPDTSLLIKAGSLMRASDGQPFTGQVYLTAVPPDKATVPLTDAATLIRVDVSERVTTTKDAVLTLPNTDGYAPGQPVEVQRPSKNQITWITGSSGNAGDKTIVIPTIRTFPSEYGPKRKKTMFPKESQTGKKEEKNKDKKKKDCEEGCDVDSRIELHSGNFQESHELVGYQSQGVMRNLMLTYNSEWADPRPILHLSYEIDDTAKPAELAKDPNSLRLISTLEAFVGNFSIQAPGVDSTSDNLRSGSNAWTVAPDSNPESWEPIGNIEADAPMQLDMRGIPTGVYNRQFIAGIRSQSANGWVGPEEITTGDIVHINEIRSPFGAGWGLEGLHKLVLTQPQQVILVDGSGEALYFERDGNDLKSPPGDFSQLEILNDGSFRRTWPDRSLDEFDAAGRLVTSTDRNDNTTLYEYDAAGLLVKLTDPVGLVTELTYHNGKLATVTDPAGRVTTFAHDSDGNLTQIQDPDGSVRTFGYDQMHHLVTQVSKREAVTTVLYGPGGRAMGEFRPTHTTSGATELFFVDTLQQQNLEPFASGATRDLVNSPLAHTEISNFVNWSGGGLAEKVEIGIRGEALKVEDAEGRAPHSVRNYESQPIVHSDGWTIKGYQHFDRHDNVLIEHDGEDYPQWDHDYPCQECGSNESLHITGGALDVNNLVVAEPVPAIASLPITLEAWGMLGRFYFESYHNCFCTEPGIVDNLVSTNTGAYSGSTYGYGFGMDSIERRDVEFFNSTISVNTPGGGVRTIPYSVAKILPHQWHHISVVYTTGNAKTYVDGQLVDDYSYTQGTDPVETKLAIGKGLQGYVDEVRVWNVARTQADIVRDMHLPLSGSEPGLADYFPFHHELQSPDGDDWQETDLSDAGPGDATATGDQLFYVHGSTESPLMGTRYTYDPTWNQITSITDPNDHQTFFEIDPVNGNTLSMREVVDAFGGANDSVTTFTYIDSGLLDTSTDPLGRVTDYEYDARQRLISVTHAQGLPEEIVWQYEYDHAGNQTAIVDPNGHRTEYQYDLMNRVTSIQESDPDGPGPLASPVTQMEFNLAGELLSTTDARGNVTHFSYDDRGAVNVMTDAMGGTTSYVRNAAGNVVAETDPVNRVTQYIYDGRQRLEQFIDPAGGHSKYEYNFSNQLIGFTDALNQRSTYIYDTRDRLIQSRDALGRTESYAYDFADNVVGHTDANGHQSVYSYDSFDRLTRLTNPLGNSTLFTYDLVGNLISATDALHHSAQYGYDALDRLTSMTDPLQGETQLEYDAAGNTTKLTDPVGNATSFVYDALHRRISETNELGDTRTFAYDAVGNLTRMVNRNGQLIRYAYDELNRRTREEWLDDAEAVTHLFQYGFDAAGQLITAGDFDSKYSVIYDANGRAARVSNNGTPGVPEVVLNYEYDAVNHLLSRSETIGGQAAGTNDYVYDAGYRLTRITQSGEGVSAKRIDLSYDNEDNLLEINRFSDLAGTQSVVDSTHAYDHIGRLTELIHDRNSENVATYSWTYDAANRITQMNSVDGSTLYTYDDNNQLVTADHSFQADESYTYDLNGNRTNAGYQTGLDNRLLSDGSFDYAYDSEGNRIRRTEIATGKVVEYQWDHRNRLVRVLERSAIEAPVLTEVRYTYDMFNRRIGETIDEDGDGPLAASTQRFVYDGDEIALSFDGDGNWTHRYLHGPAIDQILADESATGETLWPLADHLGSVRDVVDSTGALVNHVSLNSFGAITAETGPSVDHIFSFTGREFDDETGLDYYRNRYYDPYVGRFVSADPLGFSADDTNLYRYVANNPLTATDPFGLRECKDIEMDIKDLERARQMLKETLSELGGHRNTPPQLTEDGVPVIGPFSPAIGPTHQNVKQNAIEGRQSHPKSDVWTYVDDIRFKDGIKYSPKYVSLPHYRALVDQANRDYAKMNKTLEKLRKEAEDEKCKCE